MHSTVRNSQNRSNMNPGESSAWMQAVKYIRKSTNISQTGVGRVAKHDFYLQKLATPNDQ